MRTRTGVDAVDAELEPAERDVAREIEEFGRKWEALLSDERVRHVLNDLETDESIRAGIVKVASARTHAELITRVVDFIYGPLAAAIDGCGIPDLADYKSSVAQRLIDYFTQSIAPSPPKLRQDRGFLGHAERLRDAARLTDSKYGGRLHDGRLVRARPRERRAARSSSTSSASRDGPDPDPDPEPEPVASPSRRARGSLSFREAA